MIRIRVAAHPGARQDRVEWQADSSLAVWVRARAVEGQANSALCRVVADALGLRRGQVTLVSGQTSRHKIVEIEMSSSEEVRSRLLARRLRSA